MDEKEVEALFEPLLSTDGFIPQYTIKELCSESHRIAKEKGWWEGEGTTVGEKLLLQVSEIVEAFEEFRNGKDVTEVYYAPNGKPEGFPIELADVLIRIGDLCGRFDIDLNKAIKIKMLYNQTRPFRHGGKKA